MGQLIMSGTSGSARTQSGAEGGDLMRPAWLQPVLTRLRKRCPEYRKQMNGGAAIEGLADFALSLPGEPHRPSDVFHRLRWGGVFAFAALNHAQVADLARQYAAAGWLVEEGPACVREKFAGLPLPLVGRKVSYFLARKTQLMPQGQTTERFTYQVQLARSDGELSVLKQVPSYNVVLERLQRKFPDVATNVIEKRAHKFSEKIFPMFLAREATILQLLEQNLPEPYARRVPRVLEVQKDEQGLARELRMTWLRNGGQALPHLEFAHQSADLLRVIHDVGGVIHLDLRLDNFVVTEDGVGFVDFGSAVREGEDLQQNPMVGSLFQDLMRTSQIQRMLNQMTLSGHVTSDAIRHSHQKADKAVDFFYLAVQFNSPHANPDLADLIEYDPDSKEAHELSRLTAQILRPLDPTHPTFRSAQDILRGIERIRQKITA